MAAQQAARPQNHMGDFQLREIVYLVNHHASVFDFPWITFLTSQRSALSLIKQITIWLLALSWVLAVSAQTDEEQSIHVRKSSDEIHLDGVLNEQGWTEAEIAGNFWQTFPFDTSLAQIQTQVRVTYDDHHLYVAAECFDPSPGNYIVQNLRRDWSYPRTDAFVVYIDPFCDHTNGFSFGVNPFGAQREGLVQNGGGQGVTTDWDNRWFSEVVELEDRWVVEMAIPFKTLRYKAGNDIWRINFSRNSLKHNENSSWVMVPRNFNIATLAFTGRMVWDQPPPGAGSNISLIPYLAGSYTTDYTENTQTFRPGYGIDGKVALTSALNLDLTINPDFSHVEVDRQVTNLSRFSLFFPERRQFFIENSDLFSRFGFRAIRPFFSRRIGLYQGQQVPILAGARVSGKLDNNWRIGVMDMQTRGMDSLGLSPQNYAVAAVQRQMFSRSNLGFIFVNRQGFSGTSAVPNDYNRLASLEYNLASKDNRWQGKAFYQYNMNPNSNRDVGSNAAWLMYSDANWSFMYNHEWVGENFNADVGFVPRTKYLRFEPSISRKFYPKKGPVNNHGPEVYVSNYFDNKTFDLIENEVKFSYAATFQNRSELKVSIEDWYVLLQNPFDPSGKGLTPLPAGSESRWRLASLSYTKDFRQKLSYTMYSNFGGYFDGQKFTFGGNLSYRYQPRLNFTLDMESNFIQRADTFVILNLISPYVDLSISRNLFFTTFVQFNTQTQNCNLNARFQWRFKPMSDLYIVYTDNFRTSDFGIKNRSITLKLNYWLTL
jgi:hypothetical protein